MKSQIIATTILALVAAPLFAQQASVPQKTADSAPAPVPPGPMPGTKLTEAYVKEIGRYAYLWAWPMVNIHNRKLTYEKLPEPGLAGGVLPVAPPNHLSMLHNYIEPSERAVACPNQDVVYGQMVLDFSKEPVIIQVPDFGDRFWVYQVVDQRTDSFASLGKMYDTPPGLYLFVGPDWKGEKPAWATKVFRCPTHLGMVIPRSFMDDTDADRLAIQKTINSIMAYPLSKYSGGEQKRDWKEAPSFPGDTGNSEVKWVKPEIFFDQLGDVIDEVPPLPGEDAWYAQIRALLAAAEKDPQVKTALNEAALEADKELVGPLFQFRNWGLQLPHHWSTQNNGARFGTDYFTRTAVAKSNILVNVPFETKYFYQDLDESGARLNGGNSYTVTFAKGQTPPVKGFWSLTLYNEHHFFNPNPLNRYSLGTKNKTLQYATDGSLTLHVSAKSPGKDKESNWIPAPEGDFSLYIRSYWPDEEILEGKWTPPAVKKSN